jgi:hypothetical protein
MFLELAGPLSIGQSYTAAPPLAIWRENPNAYDRRSRNGGALQRLSLVVLADNDASNAKCVRRSFQRQRQRLRRMPVSNRDVQRLPVDLGNSGPTTRSAA